MADLRSRANTMPTQYPESRVLIIMTGGTICMKTSPEGLVPARGFLEQGMAPRPSFNDGSNPGRSGLVLFPFPSPFCVQASELCQLVPLSL